jgi:antitoxin component of MazEF toxin-antitoxin module
MSILKYPDRKVLKIGSTSIAITIPYEFAKRFNITRSTLVSIVSKGKTLILTFKEGEHDEHKSCENKS